MSKLDTNEFAGVADNQSTYAKYYKDNYSISGNPKGYDLEKMVANPQEYMTNIISLAKYYYHKNGLIMRTVNIIRDFGVGQITINYPTKNKKVRKVIEEFNERVDIEKVLRDILFEITLTGNCAGYNRDGERIDIYPITQVEVSPLIIDNNPLLIYKNDFMMDDYGNAGEELVEYLESAYPKEVVEGIKAGKDKIMLNVENTFFSKINSSRYEPYGVTFLLPAFDELAHKTMLKEAEKSTASAIIEKILRIGVGDKEHQPTDTEVNFYNKLITGQKGALKVTVPYFVDIKWIEPDSTIFGKEKFEQVDKDLLSALGVSLTLIRGEGGGNYSEGIISISGLIKTIESIRSGIPDIVNKWYKQELQRNNFNESLAPTIELSKVEIDNTARVEMLQWMFQNAGLPYEILYNEIGYDFTTIKLIREDENSENIEDIFKLREQPFQGNKAVDSEGGRPEKDDSERKTDKSTSNNEQPRTGRKTAGRPSTS